MNQRTWLDWRPEHIFKPGNVIYVLNTHHTQPDVTRIHLKTSQFELFLLFFLPVVLFQPLSVSGDQSKGQAQPKHTLIINLLSLVNHSHTHTHTHTHTRASDLLTSVGCICLNMQGEKNKKKTKSIQMSQSSHDRHASFFPLWRFLWLQTCREAHMTVHHHHHHHHRTTMEDSQAGRVSALQLKTRYLLPWLHVQTHNREKYSTHPGNVEAQDAFSSPQFRSSYLYEIHNFLTCCL